MQSKVSLTNDQLNLLQSVSIEHPITRIIQLPKVPFTELIVQWFEEKMFKAQPVFIKMIWVFMIMAYSESFEGETILNQKLYTNMLACGKNKQKASIKDKIKFFFLVFMRHQSDGMLVSHQPEFILYLHYVKICKKCILCYNVNEILDIYYTLIWHKAITLSTYTK